MTVRWVRFGVAAIVGVSLLVGCAKKGSVKVAEVGDWSLTLDDFRDLCVRRWGSEESAKKRSSEEIESVLRDQVVRRLKIADGYAKGLDTTPDVKQAYEDALKRAAMTRLYQVEVRDKLISEKEIKDFYNHDKEELHASHILIKEDDKTDSTAAHARAEMVYREATAPNANFADLARKYSMDTTTKQDGGDIGWFRWGQMVEPFQKVVFGMKPGQISKPFKTEYGWHIALVHGKRKVEGLEPYDKAKERIQGTMIRQRRNELGEAARNFIDKLKKDRDYKYNDANIRDVLGVFQKMLPTQDPFTMLTADQQLLPLATLDKGVVVIKVKDVSDKARTMGPTRKMFESEESLKGGIDLLATENHLLPDEAKKHGFYDDAEVVKQAGEARDNKVFQAAQEEMVTKPAEPSEEEAKTYFEQNPSKYETDAQYTLIEILLSDEKYANKLATQVRGGANIRDLARKYSERAGAAKKNGVLGPITKNQYGSIGKAASMAKLGDLVGPLQHGKKWSLFKVISKEDPKSQPFDKVKARVMGDMRIERRRQLEDKWSEDLLKSMKYKMNTAAVANLFGSPEEKKDKATENAPAPAMPANPGEQAKGTGE